MHPALHRDIRIGNPCCHQLPNCAKEKHIAGQNSATSLLQNIFQLLENRILQNRVDDEDERGENTGEERCGTFFSEEGKEGRDGGGLARRLSGRGRIGGGGRGSSGHARVNHPNRVCDEDRSAAGQGASDHRFKGC